MMRPFLFFFHALIDFKATVLFQFAQVWPMRRDRKRESVCVWERGWGWEWERERSGRTNQSTYLWVWPTFTRKFTKKSVRTQLCEFLSCGGFKVSVSGIFFFFSLLRRLDNESRASSGSHFIFIRFPDKTCGKKVSHSGEMESSDLSRTRSCNVLTWAGAEKSKNGIFLRAATSFFSGPPRSPAISLSLIHSHTHTHTHTPVRRRCAWLLKSWLRQFTHRSFSLSLSHTHTHTLQVSQGASARPRSSRRRSCRLIIEHSFLNHFRYLGLKTTDQGPIRWSSDEATLLTLETSLWFTSLFFHQLHAYILHLDKIHCAWQ